MFEIRDVRRIGILDEDPADHASDIAGILRQRLQNPHEAQVFLFLEERAGVGFELRRDDHLAEDFRDRLGEREGDRVVADDDASERGLLVGGERLFPGLAQIRVGADPAGVRVLENRDRGPGEFLDEISGGADIEDVVVGKFLAVELLEMLAETAVELGFLVGVFAVAQTHLEWQVEAEARARLLLLVEEVRDCGIVGGSRRERLDGEPLAELAAGPAALLAQVLDHRRIVRRVGHHADGPVIF